MILAMAVVVGLIVSLARHGRNFLNRVAAIPLRSAWLALLALFAQWPLLRAKAGPQEAVRLQQTLFLASHLLLLAFVWRNRRSAGILIVGLGVVSNLAVTIANGGFMAITPQTLTRINPGSSVEQWPEDTHYGYSKDVILSRQDTRLYAMSDILVLPPPFPRPTAFSIGDLLIALGVVVVLQGQAVRTGPVGRDPRPS